MIGITLLWMPILVSAIIVFIASSIIHMGPFWHRRDFARLANEAQFIESVRPLQLPPRQPTSNSLRACARRCAPRAARKQGLKSTYIRVRAHDGVVTLSGVVANENQISLATSMAQGVSGVRNVNSKIEVRSGAGAPLGNQ